MSDIRTLSVDRAQSEFLDRHRELIYSRLFQEVLAVLIDIESGTRRPQGEIFSLAAKHGLEFR